jgi:NAD(P)-dependent dehydrogenase (short-subunit alcohol dehydrogenase family)
MSAAPVLDAVLDRTLIGYSNVGYRIRRHFWPPDPAPDALRGRVAIVTGANSGLGKATATGLARLGATVRMVVRRPDAGEAARADILAAVPGADVLVERCDVSSLDAVRRYAEGFDGPLHVLVHNAGVMPEERTLSADGHELALATHVLGPHLLTSLLRPALVRDGAGRVVWVTSGGMYAHKLPAGDLEYEQQEYRPAVAYARTKRMQSVLTRCWAEQLRGDGAVVHAVHPGWVDTPGIARGLPRFRALVRPLLRTLEQGADTAVWLAAAGPPAGSTGELWHDRARRPWHYTRATRETPAERQSFWATCQRLIGAAA